MKKYLALIVGWLLLLIAFSVYAYAIYVAIYKPLDGDDSLKIHIPQPLDTFASTIGAILLTNLGAVLGISITNQKSALSAMTLINRDKAINPDPITQREILQYAAVILYIIVLIACFIKWAICTFQEPASPIVPLIAQNGKELIGVIAAYLAFVLGVNRS